MTRPWGRWGERCSVTIPACGAATTPWTTKPSRVFFSPTDLSRKRPRDFKTWRRRSWRSWESRVNFPRRAEETPSAAGEESDVRIDDESKTGQTPGGQGEEICRYCRLFLTRGVHHPRSREGARQARGRRLGRGDSQEASRAGLHLLTSVRNTMSSVNAVLRPIFELLLSPFRGLPSIMGLAVVSLVTAIAMLLIFKKTSNQKAIAAVKRRIHACLFEIRLLNGRLRAISRAQSEILPHKFAQLRPPPGPIVGTIPPFVLVIA